MTRLHAALKRFWLEPVVPDALAFLRVAVAGIALVQLVILWPYLRTFYGNYGLVQWVVTDLSSRSWTPSVGMLALKLAPLGISATATLYGVFSLYGVSLVGMLLGYRTRLFAVLVWAMHGLTSASATLSLYGVDTLLHVLFFYLAVMPTAGRWSLDALAGRASGEPSSLARVAQRTLQIHLCFIYLNTGLAKAQGIQWWTGEALWRALMQPQFNVFDFSWLAAHPFIAQLACWGTLVIEVGYAGMIWVPRLRRPWLLTTLMLHAGIAVCLRLWLFSLTMMAFNLAAFAWGPRPAVAPEPPEDDAQPVRVPDAALLAAEAS